MHSLPGYSGSEDCVAMETLLQGYDEQDEDQVYRVCNSPLLKYMDNDVSTAVLRHASVHRRSPTHPRFHWVALYQL